MVVGWQLHRRFATNIAQEPNASGSRLSGSPGPAAIDSEESGAGPSPEVVVQTAVALLGGPRQARIELIGRWAVEDPAAAFEKAISLGEV